MEDVLFLLNGFGLDGQEVRIGCQVIKDKRGNILFSEASEAHGDLTFVSFQEPSTSPDQQILPLVFKQGDFLGILCLNANFQVICRVGLVQDFANFANFVSVGWGSKETQFHGKEGISHAGRTTHLKPQTNKGTNNMHPFTRKLFLVTLIYY